ncbi:MAG: hypothetical protein HY902_16225 [Deltaproteobacteria bacterium]|nr:hypothetical protein [Deltaproteobacteria bacterium]
MKFQNKSAMGALMAAALALTACGSSGTASSSAAASAKDASGSSDTSAVDTSTADTSKGDASAADGAADTASTKKLQEGNYLGATGATIKSNCGPEFSVVLGNTDLRWVDSTKFTLTSMGPKSVFHCTAGSPTVCDPVEIAVPASPTYTQKLGIVTKDVVVKSSTEFTMILAFTVGCEGASCTSNDNCEIEIESNYTAGGCDVLLSNCSDPATSKCTIVPGEEGQEITTTCKPFLGKAKLGEPCNRPNDVVGEDTCDTGLFCSYYGLSKSTPQQRVCRQMCELESPCPTGTKCFGVNGSQLAGHCAPACTPFVNNCGSPELTCKMLQLVSAVGAFDFTCSWSGSVADFAECTKSEECAPNSHCRQVAGGKALCSPLCDDAHPCADKDAVCLSFTSWTIANFGSCTK